MNKITNLYVFVLITGDQERIMMAPDCTGQMVPLAYTTKESIEEAKVRQLVEALVKNHKVCFELREYKLVGTLETFEPMLSTLTM